MLEIAVVGAGLCGVSLASSLHGQGRSVALFEARSRLGGRILSATCAKSGLGIDLGPTWFWPENQPVITRLVAELGLADFPQYDEGSVLHLRDPDKKPEQLEAKSVHGGARRLEGGMASLVDALVKDLPRDVTHLDHILTNISDRGDHVVLTFRHEDCVVEIKARHVVLAMPPRLLDEHVRFEPELNEATRQAMIGTETWMAAQAKVVMTYERPFWRDAGQSGSAFVTHEQAVVGEVFDACDAELARGALGGFIALSPELRQSFKVGLPMLMGNQMVQIFGPELEQDEQYYQDWATEPYTCSALDREKPAAEHSAFANPLLRRALWDGKLYLGGAETASEGAGYLEGALSASQRVDRSLGRARIAAAQHEEKVADGDALEANSPSLNAASLASFNEWVVAQSDVAFDDYHRRLNASLAAQQREQLTQRSILGSIEAIYNNALGMLDSLTFDMASVGIERGRSALMPDVQRPFRNVMQSLLNDVVAFNRTSCALSNFPDEHHPSKEYMQTIMRDIAAAWQEFLLSANAILLAKVKVPDYGSPVSSETSRSL